MARKKQRKINKRIAEQRRKRLKKKIIMGLIVAAFLLGTLFIMLYRYVSKFPEDKVVDNVWIGTMDVSGMTEKEVKAKLEEQLINDKSLTVPVVVNGQNADAALEEYGLAYADLDKTVKEAVHYGKDGSLWSRFWKLRKLSKEKAVLDENLMVDEEASTTLLKDRAVPLANHAQDATIEKNASGFDITPEQAGETVDIEATIAALETHLNDSWNHQVFTIDATVKAEEPKVTAADLESIQDELGSYSTDAGGGERRQNLVTGVEKLNGTVLMPGEEISVHAVTAPYDAEHGYVPAGSYENGQVVETYGGGICQVSTTLYNAVLYAELEVVKRYPHSMVVAYVEPSRDAAIAGTTKDFVFKNNYDTPVYIFGEIDSSNQLRFAIYGKDTREAGRSIKFEVEILSTTEPKTKYKTSSERELGSMTTTTSPHTGKEARLWKVVLKDGQEVSRDVINNSSYNKADKVITVGTKSSNMQAAELVIKAVDTQDKDKINAAISQAKALEAGAEEEEEETEADSE